MALAGGIILPVYVVYFRHWNVTLFEVAVLAAVFEATIIVFEVPTGIFADRFGRKLSTLTGFLFFSISGFIFFSFRSFWGFLIAEIVFGVAETFISGALEALAVESLESDEQQAGLFASRSAFRTFGILVGMVSAGYIADKYLAELFIPVIILGVFGIVLSLLLKEVRATSEGNNGSSGSSESIIEIIAGNRAIMALFAVGLLANFVYEGPDQFWQVLFSEIKRISPLNFGYLTAIGLILVTVSIKFTERLYDKLSSYLTVIFLITAISFFVISKLSIYPAMAGIVAYFALKEFVRPAISTHLNRRFESSNRATYLSTYNLTCSVGEVLAGVIAGIVALKFGVVFIFYFSFGAALLVPLVYFILSGLKRSGPQKA